MNQEGSATFFPFSVRRIDGISTEETFLCCQVCLLRFSPLKPKYREKRDILLSVVHFFLTG